MLTLDIDVEYQSWILVGATVLSIWLCCMPCYLAGHSAASARRTARLLQQHQASYMFIALFGGVVLIGLSVLVCPDFTLFDYFRSLFTFIGWLARHLVDFALAALVVLGALLLYASRERLATAFGVEHVAILRWSPKDALLPWASNERAVDLVLWRVAELESASAFAPNSVFVEAHLGFNEPAKTRVHNNAGSAAVLKERLQLNFRDDAEDDLVLLVKTQNVVGSTEVARCSLRTKDVLDLEQQWKNGLLDGFGWVESGFVQMRLEPFGRLWLRVEPVDEDGAGDGATGGDGVEMFC